MTATAAEYPGFGPGREIDFAPLKYAAIAAGAIALVSELGSRLSRERNPTEIGGELSDHIAFGGLGTPWSNEIARDITVATGTPIRDVRYASSDLTIEGMGAAFGKHCEDRIASGVPREELRTNILGFSLGTVLGLNAAASHARNCRRLGLPVHPVDTIIAISSPYTVEDTHMELLVNIIARSKYSGGPATQLICEFFSAMHDRGYNLSNVPGAAKWAATSYGRGDPTPMWTGKLQILAAEEICKPGFLNGLVTPDTTIFQLGDEHTDKITKIAQARRTGTEIIADQYGCEIINIDTPGLGHANVEGSLPYITEILGRRAVKATGLARPVISLPRALRASGTAA